MSQHRNSVSETERKSWNEGDASLGAHQISFKEQHLACVISGFFSQYKVFFGGGKKKTFQFWHCQSSFLLLSSVILAGRLLRAAGNCCKKKENVIKKPLAEQSNFLHNQFLLKIDFKRKKSILVLVCLTSLMLLPFAAAAQISFQLFTSKGNILLLKGIKRLKEKHWCYFSIENCKFCRIIDWCLSAAIYPALEVF